VGLDVAAVLASGMNQVPRRWVGSMTEHLLRDQCRIKHKTTYPNENFSERLLHRTTPIAPQLCSCRGSTCPQHIAHSFTLPWGNNVVAGIDVAVGVGSEQAYVVLNDVSTKFNIPIHVPLEQVV
jgi:hypothetical protein